MIYLCYELVRNCIYNQKGMENSLKIRLADMNIKILTDSEYLFHMCAKYIGEFNEPDFIVEINQSDIDYEERLFHDRNHPAGQYKPHSGILESLAVYRKIAEEMIERDTLLFHGSAIAVDGICYLFCADSGTGKSTHTRLWRNYFKDRAVMVNDDKPLIRIKENGVMVYGTPWSGKHKLDTNINVPLKAVCFLERGKENKICKITKGEVLSELLRYSYRTSDPVHLQKSLSLLVKMNEQVSFYRLACNMDPSACLVSYEGMNSNGEDNG